MLFSSSESWRGGSPSDNRFLARGSWGSGSLGGTLGNCRGGEGSLGGGDGSLGGGDGSLGGGDGSLRGGEGGLGGVEKTGPEGSGSAKLRSGLGGFPRGIWIGSFLSTGSSCCCWLRKPCWIFLFNLIYQFLIYFDLVDKQNIMSHKTIISDSKMPFS